MRGRRLLLFAVVLGAALAAGSGTATGASDVDCPEDGSTVVGDIGGEWVDGTETLVEDSRFDLAYCNGGDASTTDWLAEGDGFTISESASEDGIYTVTLTGDGSGRIAFAKHVTLNAGEADGLTVEVAMAGTGGSTLEGIDDPRAVAYLDARAALANATAELDETTTAIENGEADITAAEDDLNELNDAYGTMTAREEALTDYLLNRTENGNASGVLGALAAVRTNASEQRNATAATLERYREVVEAERTAAQSTVRLTTVGSLAAGLVAGGSAGVAVPLVAARRVEEAMKLSRNVSYDRKTALVPILVGIVLAIAGVALLTAVVDPSLLEVVR
ncbi:hypothetical protein [Natrinema sp. 74]|uniref:hypothetical protein n=1 Tax=Natrinema sp. 74 TaxID=3384159 RepID=UPI0038D36571